MNSIFGAQLSADASGQRLESNIIDLYFKSRLDLSKDYPDPQVLIASSDGQPLCTRGNISFVSGLAGSRKSFLCTAIGGAFLKPFLGLENPNYQGEPLLWCDTEQADGHVARVMRRLYRIAGLPTNRNDDRIVMLALREYPYSIRRKIIEVAIEQVQPSFIVIDGIADLIAYPNSSEQSEEIVQWAMTLSKVRDCHVISVIHSNLGDPSKPRGHLGASLLRKAETGFSITAKGDISSVSFAKSRDVKSKSFDFEIYDGLPTLVGEGTPLLNNDERKREERLRLFEDILRSGESLTHSDLVKKIHGKTTKGESTCKTYIREAISYGIIYKNRIGLYSLTCEEPQQSEFDTSID